MGGTESASPIPAFDPYRRTVKVTRNSPTFPAVRQARPYDVQVGYPPVWADLKAGVSGHRALGVNDVEPMR